MKKTLANSAVSATEQQQNSRIGLQKFYHRLFGNNGLHGNPSKTLRHL
jgi:hypothetical protein